MMINAARQSIVEEEEDEPYAAPSTRRTAKSPAKVPSAAKA
jgi:hypothetical protein